MDHRNANVYYASRGEFVTLDGEAFVGTYYVKSSGILMTTPTDLSKSQVIVSAVGRNIKLTEPLGVPEPNTDLNENLTQYDLLPVLYNDPPIILEALEEASTPQIKPSAAAGTLPNGKYMYQFPDGAVKVHTGTLIKLQVLAEQPPILNVENGKLEIINPKVGLTYTWLVDGKNVPKEEVVSSLRSSRTVSGSVLTITNMIPRFAGNYTCIVNNDIGSTDGGSVNLDVYNSNIDSYFYTNLVKNPNGELEGGLLGTSSWNSLQGVMVSKQLGAKTIGRKDKSIVADVMTPDFQWTREMLSPRPYQINGGILQNNPLENLKSYFTREKYQYELKGGNTVAQIYQDIELGDLTDHIKGSIYGVSGVSAIVSFYIGNALWVYEPTLEKLSPDESINKDNYNLGAARISLENFANMGPGFVEENAYVTIEEYSNSQIVQRQGNVTRDPWNRRLGQYSNKVYYPGGRGSLQTPDEASQGDNRDRHLFVADELMPNQNDRYTYGQYAEFVKIVIPKLNPKTNKIRIIFSIEASSTVATIVQSLNKWEYGSSSDGIYYLPNWAGSWPYGSMGTRYFGSTWDSLDKPWNFIKANYRVSEPWPAQIEQRVPKQSTSRALATGFNLTLVPDETDRGVDNRSSIQSMQSVNTSVKSLIPSPINQALAVDVFDPYDTGERNLDVLFGMNGIGEMAIRVKESKNAAVNKDSITYTTLPWFDGLFPFSPNTQAEYITFSPTRIGSISTDTTIQIPPYKVGEIPTTSGYLLPPYIKTFPADTALAYVQLSNGGLNSGNGNTAPSYPKDWYTIAAIDRLAIYQGTIKKAPGSITSQSAEIMVQGTELTYQQETRFTYSNWATPKTPKNLQAYIDDWNNNQSAFSTVATPTATQWDSKSRFIITIGVHNTTYNTEDLRSLHSMQSYYMDIIKDTITLHKTKNLGDQAFLPSFNEIEQITESQLELLKYNNSQPDSVIFENANRATGGGVTGEYDLYTTSVGEMIPVSVVVDFSAGEVGTDLYSKIVLPSSLLRRSISGGGFNVPATVNEIFQSQNVVDATISLLSSYAGTIPDMVLTTNRTNASDAINSTIAAYIPTTLNAIAGKGATLAEARLEARNFIRAFVENQDKTGIYDISPTDITISKYPWGNSDSGGLVSELYMSYLSDIENKTAAELSLKYDYIFSEKDLEDIKGTGDATEKLRTEKFLTLFRRIDSESELYNVLGIDAIIATIIMLNRRRDIITSTYDRLLSGMTTISERETIMNALTLDPITTNGTQETVASMSDTLPTLASMYIDESFIIDPSFKTILYGVRPAPLTPIIDFSNNTISTRRFTGTPLYGTSDNNFNTYTVRNINIVNE